MEVSKSRRDFLRVAGLSGASLLIPGCAGHRGPLSSSVWPALEANNLPYAGLATSLRTEHDYVASVEGSIPESLRGILYRIGPGLYDRGGMRKRMMLDGDGMIQAFEFGDASVRYRNRFVRTKKFTEEEAAGRFLYATWGTPAPGGVLANLGGQVANQASVTVIRRGESLFAFDEYAEPYELKADNLETVGVTNLGAPLPRGYKAHWKIDAQTGEWLHFGMSYGRRNYLYIVSIGRSGSASILPAIPIPRRIYIHDWFVSQRHVIFVLHPAVIPMSGVLAMLLGMGTIGSLIRWEPALGNLLLVARRDGEGEPLLLEAEACWMWHALNAYEIGDEIIADFVGSAQIAGLGSADAPMFRLMEGQDIGPADPRELPVARRYIIDVGSKTVRGEIIADDLQYEMPFLAPASCCYRHRYGYFAAGPRNEWFWHKIARMEMDSGKTSFFDFGGTQYCTEPVFVPEVGGLEGGTKIEPGWVLTQVYDSQTKKSFLAVLRAENLPAGPVGIVHLSHHVPLSFHGYWQGKNERDS